MALLKIKKFSMQRTYECIDFMIPFMKSYSEWFSNPGPADYEFTDKPNSPLIYLKNLDAEGRRVYIYKMKNFENFDDIQFFRRYFLTAFFIVFEKNAQENGIVAIMDFTDANLGKMMSIPIAVMSDSLKMPKNGLMRLKQLNMIGMPSFLKPLFEIAKSFTSAKMLQRINFINDIAELSQHMDVTVLPPEYGGSSSELLDYAAFEVGISCIKKLNKFEVNFGNIQQVENVGSFRKLEVD
jgi:hypothetical protein